MITDYVPGAYVTHDMLHMRGGHQTEWLIDGVPVPNTNIAKNLGPQIRSQRHRLCRSAARQLWRRVRRPHLRRLQRSSAHRLRTQPPSELVLSAGNFYQTNDAVSCRQPHRALRLLRQRQRQSQQSRLQTPIPQVVHDAVNGYGGFGSFIFNFDPTNQFRLVGFPAPGLLSDPLRSLSQLTLEINPCGQRGSTPSTRPARWRARSRWLRDFLLGAHLQLRTLLLTVSPFYHYNSADYQEARTMFPSSPPHSDRLNYAGAQVSLQRQLLEERSAGWSLQILPAPVQLLRRRLQRSAECAPPNVLHHSIGVNGGLTPSSSTTNSKSRPWLTSDRRPAPHALRFLTAAVVSESAIDPRFGVAVTFPA